VTATTAEELRYRVSAPGDLPALLDLWSQHSGWGPITEAQWRSWYERAPHGPALVVVGEDREHVPLAMTVFMPCRLRVNNVNVTAVRVSAPIVHASVRGSAMPKRNEPATELFLEGRRFAAEQGFAVMFALPESGWVARVARAGKWMPGVPRQFAVLNCVGVDVTAITTATAIDQFAFSRISQFTGEYSTLWTSAVESYPISCGVVRSPEWLLYKHAADIVLAARNRSGGLIGFVAISPRTGAVTNMLSARPDELSDVLRGAIAWMAAARASGDSTIPQRVSAVVVPGTEAALRAAGFTPIDYQFGFVADTLDDTRVPLSALDPTSWYLTAGD
jgi:hypothetical protein